MPETSRPARPGSRSTPRRLAIVLPRDDDPPIDGARAALRVVVRGSRSPGAAAAQPLRGARATNASPRRERMPAVNRILCPIDFSDTSDHAVSYAVMLA